MRKLVHRLVYRRGCVDWGRVILGLMTAGAAAVVVLMVRFPHQGPPSRCFSAPCEGGTVHVDMSGLYPFLR